ncbi:cytokine receptor [Drosophila virilis]|uniref:cytokine receptor n=1 Tax=Drosophila virilis TaxID=7244 RepID=UPI00139646C9|nr:cytokine receptor [Drosophila virilis]
MQINKQKRTMQQLTLALALLFGLHILGSNGQHPSPGWVVPEKAEVPVGSDLNISCTINQAFFDSSKTNESCNVSDLYFKANINGRREYFNGTDLQLINDTTILLSFTNMSDQEGEYLCMCKEMGMFSSQVDVGTKPLPVDNFDCTSYDWEYMFCNFTAPRNSINTKYNISFTTEKNTNYRYYVDCNFDASPQVNCNITSEQYKKFPEWYYFHLDIANSLGNDTQDIKVDNVERMILARPGQNLRVLNRTQDSICLTWEMPRRSNFIGGVLWQVHVTPENFPIIKRPMWRNSSSAAKDTLCLTELPYPGYNYLLELRVRNNKTKSRWSQPLSYPFRTVAERPARPPRMTNGSFYVYSTGESLTLYWEQLAKHELNGDNFTYIVSEYRCNNTITDPSRIKVDTNSATIENYTQDAYHEIYIRSSNNVNTSVEASRLVIPMISSEDTSLRVPMKIQRVYHSSNSSYTLGWKAPRNISQLIDYTVFWCNAKPALLSKCNGSIHFEHVAPDRLEYSTASGQSPSLNMAVSANYLGRNTGMHWVTCTGDGNDDLAKMDPAIDDVTNTSLTVKWGTEGVCAAILSGYNLTYCQRSEGKADNCTTKELTKDVTVYTINDLEPFTYYGIKMSMYSLKRASKYSDELIWRTNEGAPTPPRELFRVNGSSSSVTLAWKPPLKANGLLRDYLGTVYHNNKTFHFELRAFTEQLVDTEKLIHYELNNLTAYTEYEIVLRARTVLYSEPSNVISFRTAVGVPSPPTLMHVENTQLSTTLEWMAPQRPAGRLEYYEVVIIERNANNTVIGQPLSYVSARPNLTCVMATPVCTPLHRFHYQVRAVNAEPLHPEVAAKNTMWRLTQTQKCVAQPPLTDGEWSAIQTYKNSSLYRLYKSSWAKHEVSCSPDPSNTKLLVSSMEVIVALIVLGVVCHTGYRKYQKMADIDLVLPPGIVETLKKPIEIGVMSGSGGGNAGNGSGGVVGGIGSIVCTRIDPIPDYNIYSPHDMPHDFSSGNESSKLLLANNSSNNYEEPATARRPPASYMSMSQGLLLDDDGQAGATELQTSNSNATPSGYIKPTKMMNWSTPNSSMANTLPSGNAQSPPQPQSMLVTMPLSGYVPVQVLQARPTPAPVASTMSSNYVQAADLHKLKPATTAAVAVQAAAAPAPIGVATVVSATAATGAATTTTTTALSSPSSPMSPPPPATTTTTLMPNGFGYTAMEQLQRNGLMKPTGAALQQSAATAQNAQQTTHRLQPNIGGYVTPQDLNALAHNRHML